MHSSLPGSGHEMYHVSTALFHTVSAGALAVTELLDSIASLDAGKVSELDVGSASELDSGKATLLDSGVVPEFTSVETPLELSIAGELLELSSLQAASIPAAAIAMPTKSLSTNFTTPPLPNTSAYWISFPSLKALPTRRSIT